MNRFGRLFRFGRLLKVLTLESIFEPLELFRRLLMLLDPGERRLLRLFVPGDSIGPVFRMGPGDNIVSGEKRGVVAVSMLMLPSMSISSCSLPRVEWSIIVTSSRSEKSCCSDVIS